jgi:hypothetical protein
MELPGHTKLIDAAINGPSKWARKLARERVEQLPAREAVPALISWLQAANSKSSFQPLTLLLASHPTRDSVDELWRQARENRQFPLLPIRALGLCRHPAAEDALLSLMEDGKSKQRRTAMDCLANISNSGRAIAPLCKVVGSDRQPDREYARHILHRMGRPNKLALRALKDPNLEDMACATTLLALETVPVYLFPLLFRPFNAEGFLVAAMNRKTPDADRISAVLARLREHCTLLRAAESQTADRLMRASSNSDQSNPKQLLRSSEGPDDLCANAESWWRRLLPRK